MSDAKTKCKRCGADVTARFIMCDEVEGEYCDDCFEAATQCDAKHGEGCATIVMSGSSNPEPA